MFKLLNVSLAAAIGLGVTQASADDGMSRAFRLVNHSDRTIVMVVAGHIGKDFDPIDLIGDDETIRPGESTIVVPVDPQGWCRFNLGIMPKNGYLRVGNVNVCDIKVLTIYGNANDGFYFSVSN